MKAKLYKREDRYDLYAENDHKIASSTPNTFGKLSKQNCDKIFGVVDVEKLAEESWGDKISSPYHAYVDGFNKAMELNQDKLFTLEDMRTAMTYGVVQEGTGFEGIHSVDDLFNLILRKVSQPTEIEVEIEMEDVIQLKKRAGGITNMGKPKLDSEGCLILKKI